MRAADCQNHLHQLHVCLPSREGHTRLLYRMSMDFMDWTRHVPGIQLFWKSIAGQVPPGLCTQLPPALSAQTAVIACRNVTSATSRCGCTADLAVQQTHYRICIDSTPPGADLHPQADR